MVPSEEKNKAGFPPRSAGELMVTNIPTIGEAATIAEVETLLLKRVAEFETIHYIYVVDAREKLTGVISIKEVFRSPKGTRVEAVMTRNPISLHMHTQAERVALLAIEHNLKAMPVVDGNGRLLGVISSDAILAILHQRNIEDFLKFAGIHRFKDSAKELIVARAGTIIRKRLPWLLVGLLGGLVAALVVSAFEETIEQELLLVAFVPAIAYIADAVGTQTQTIFIRSLAIDRALRIGEYLLREIKVALGLAATLGGAMGIIGFFIGSKTLGFILGGSFFTAILTAAGVGVFFPYLFLKLKYDPAIASGPLATVIRDIVSLAIYLSFANAALTLAAS